MYNPPTYPAVIRAIQHLCGETTSVPLDVFAGGPGAQAVIDVPLEWQSFIRMQRDVRALSSRSQSSCWAWADSVAALELPAYWRIGVAPFVRDHVWVVDGWETIAPGQFGYAFPIEEEVPPNSGTFQGLARTILVPSGGTQQPLVLRLLVQVQSAY